MASNCRLYSCLTRIWAEKTQWIWLTPTALLEGGAKKEMPTTIIITPGPGASAPETSQSEHSEKCDKQPVINKG